jgi:hypothetical protein
MHHPNMRQASTAPSAAAYALQAYLRCIAGQPPSFDHARNLMHEHGMVQFAQEDRVHLAYGYCLDDNARAFLAAVLSLHLDPDLEVARTIADASLSFIERCRRPDGQYHNLMDENGAFTDEVGSQEAFGRTMWACGIAACCAPSQDWRERCTEILRLGFARFDDLTDLRPRAYLALGLAAAVAPERAAPAPTAAKLPQALEGQLRSALVATCERLRERFERHSTLEWPWWEPVLTWGNARLPEAMLRGAAALEDPNLETVGWRSLEFLASATQPQGTFVPIGNDGWFERGGKRAIYDQQPIEACAMVDLWLAASKITGQMQYATKALETFGWFFGANTERFAMVDPSGGCRDGLGHRSFNVNMGAESTLSYLQAHAVMALALRRSTQAR